MPPFFRALRFLSVTTIALVALLASSSADDLRSRIDTRSFPSVFQAWSTADNLKQEPREFTVARHDLAIESPERLGLRWNDYYRGLANGFRPDSIAPAREARAKLLELNPHLVLIAEIRYRDARDDYLPENSPWWQRQAGVRRPGWAEGHFFMLDYPNADFRAQVARQAHAAMATGVFDGVFLDWWKEDDDRVALVQAVREAVGENALILVNSNDLPAPRSAPYVNGLYMECFRSATNLDWNRIAETLRWAEATLRSPRINCVETWYHNSRHDLALMRATTTLTLTMSNGYCLFGDPDPLLTPDHLHDWYDFWDRRLGRPMTRGAERLDHGWERAFENGSAVYNPMGNTPIIVHFDQPHQRLSNGETAAQFSLSPGDGDLFLGSATDSHLSPVQH